MVIVLLLTMELMAVKLLIISTYTFWVVAL
jgi:hypothetical protein